MPLVDSEGFPRADIDVWDVRVKRGRLACIETDHGEIMKRIEKLVQEIHQEAKLKGAFRTPAPAPATAASSSSTAATAPVPMQVVEEGETQPPTTATPRKHVAFALIDQVFRSSPAEEAGLKEGDLLVEFGSVDAENHANFSAIVQLVQDSVGRPIRVVVRRKEGTGSNYVTLSLTPHTWSGRGLLGCHLSALSS